MEKKVPDGFMEIIDRKPLQAAMIGAAAFTAFAVAVAAPAGPGGVAAAGGFNSGFEPLSVTSFVLTKSVFGACVPVHRLVNLILYVGAALGVWWALMLYVKNVRVAFYAGVLFAVHPVHLESAAALAGRSDLLGCIFFMSSWAVYMHGRARGGLRGVEPWALAGSAGLFLLAMLSSPAAASLPLVIAAANHFRRTESAGKLYRRTWWHYTPYLGIIAVVMLFRALALGSVYEPAASEGDNALAGRYLDERIATGIVILGRYALMLLVPLSLSADAGGVDVISFFTAPGLVAAFLLTASVVLAVFASKKWKILAFGGVFGLFTLFLNLNILYIARFDISDRFLLLPSVGVALILARLIVRLSSTGARSATFAGAASYAGFLLVASILRSIDLL